MKAILYGVERRKQRRRRDGKKKKKKNLCDEKCDSFSPVFFCRSLSSCKVLLLCLDSVRYIYVPCVVKVRPRNRLGCNRKGGEKGVGGQDIVEEASDGFTAQSRSAVRSRKSQHGPRSLHFTALIHPFHLFLVLYIQKKSAPIRPIHVNNIKSLVSLNRINSQRQPSSGPLSVHYYDISISRFLFFLAAHWERQFKCHLTTCLQNDPS